MPESAFRGASRMPWTTEYYPNAIQHLAPAVREKAVEIANALLAQGEDEGKAIRVAIVKAKEWARNRGLPVADWQS
jgi:uncharacterized protein YdaT